MEETSLRKAKTGLPEVYGAKEAEYYATKGGEETTDTLVGPLFKDFLNLSKYAKIIYPNTFPSWQLILNLVYYIM